MTININTRPNSLSLTGDTRVSAHFGSIQSITAINLAGPNHTPHVQIRFQHGVRLDLSPEVLSEMCRGGAEALAKLGFPPDIRDCVEIEQ